MKIALLGLPQAGKRTLFTLLTGRRVPESRKPGELVEGMASIRDARVDELARICLPERTVYAENQFALCPDVQEGAASREWLDAARKCDLLCLVTRGFTSDQVYHPAGSVDPARDRNALLAELVLADMERIDTRLTRIDKEAKAGLSSQVKLEQDVLRLCQKAMEEDQRLDAIGLEEHQLAAVKSLTFLTLVPVLEVRNVDEDQLAEDLPADTVAVSALIEQEIMAMDDEAERAEYLETLGLSDSGLDRVNAAAYQAQGLMSFYTMGKDEARAWTIRQGAHAPEAGGKIHSDIERGFIRVEVIKFDDLKEAGSEKAAKEHGKSLQKGKDYVIEDGDICHFLFSV